MGFFAWKWVWVLTLLQCLYLGGVFHLADPRRGDKRAQAGWILAASFAFVCLGFVAVLYGARWEIGARYAADTSEAGISAMLAAATTTAVSLLAIVAGPTFAAMNILTGRRPPRWAQRLLERSRFEKGLLCVALPFVLTFLLGSLIG